jgi:hypothetical protein
LKSWRSGTRITPKKTIRLTCVFVGILQETLAAVKLQKWWRRTVEEKEMMMMKDWQKSLFVCDVVKLFQRP